MSTETNENGTSANAAPPNAQPPANAAPATQLPDPNREPENDPPWLAKRLEQAKRVGAKDADVAARKAILAELGIDDPATIKKLAEDEKKRAEERKSLEQRVAERDAALKAKADRNTELEESVKSYADMQLAGLTEAQKAAVVKVAGNDPPKQLKAIEALRPTWEIVAPPQVAPIVDGVSPTNQSQAGPPATPPKPAAPTGPAAIAPPPAGTPVVANHLETYEQLQKLSPFDAATYYQANYAAINAARSQRSN